MDKILIKKYQKEIREATSQEQKERIASNLHTYIGTLPTHEQEEYKSGVLSIIESKFDVMDKLIAAYEAIRKDDLVMV
jgi:hypothetical protein